jgi:hypothetical protein
MKVVQEGSLTKRVTCKRCKSELEYEPEDVKFTSYEDSGKYHIQCPFCLKRLGERHCFVYVPEPSKEAKS